ncbi:Fc.00g057990.m01.CDS01 [Cosmosporella sp. VM-42]
MVAPAVKAPVSAAAVPKVLPAIMVIGAATAVVGYVQSQLKTNSRTMDSFFAKYNTPESEASRRETFKGLEYQDPRTNFFNVLSWKKL